MRHASLVLVPLAALTAMAAASGTAAQTQPVAGHKVDVSRNRASLTLQLPADRVVDITLGGGQVRINSQAAGRYEQNDALDIGWRNLLDSAGGLATPDAMRLVKSWKVPGLSGEELATQQGMVAAMSHLTAVPASSLVELAPPPPPPPSDQIVGPARVREYRILPVYGGVGASVAGLLGAFVALGCIAFGLVSFFPRQLDIVSETVQHSFVRSFFAGLFAQPLLVPALGTLIVALVLTVVGIIAIPVAIIAFVLAVIVAVVGGYIAAARALGEIYMRRKTARGASVSPDPAFRAILVGLGSLLMIWAPFAFLGWIPGFGIALLIAAMIFTWLMATVGLGATILSRAGLRGRFGSAVNPQLSGEVSWSTVDEIAPSRRGEGTRK
jgi:hypothetical protein